MNLEESISHGDELIRGRSRRLFIHKILKNEDEWTQGDI